MKTKFLLLIFVTVGLINQSYSQTIMNIYQSGGNVTQIPVSTIDSITYTSAVVTSNLPTVITSPVTNINSPNAVSGGEVTDDGGSTVIQYGVCLSNNPTTEPTIDDFITIDGSGTGVFVSNLNNLILNYTYYVRAYAINSNGVSYGNTISFYSVYAQNIIVSNPGNGVVLDGYNYPTIVLGNGQEWMAENLRTTVYANGDPIPNIQNNSQWGSIEADAYCYYLNDVQYQNIYGNLYNFYAVADNRNVCPTGWHVPNDLDWQTLINYLDVNAAGGMSSNTSGGKMKVTGTQFWQSPNEGATNESGFSALPSGWRIYGAFEQIGTWTYFWSSSSFAGVPGGTFDLNSTSSWAMGADGGSGDPNPGNAVRCIKD